MLASLLYGPFLSPAAGDASRRKAEQQGQDGTESFCFLLLAGERIDYIIHALDVGMRGDDSQ